MRVRELVWIFLAAFGVQLIALGVPSYWYDEAATLRLARLPLDDFAGFVAHRDIVHAAYDLFMHGWIRLFGESELATRMPSAIAAAATTVGVFALTKRYGGSRRGAYAAAIIFTLLPRTVVQASDARSFAIATALVVGAALLLPRAVDPASVDARPTAPARRTWRWVAFTAVGTLAIIWFAYAVLVLPAFTVLAWRSGRVQRWLTLAPAVLASPLLLAVASQRGQVAWLAEQTVNLYTVLVESFFGFSIVLTLATIAIIAVGILRRSLRASVETIGLAVWLLLPAAALLIASAVFTPLFTPRYLVISTPALAILCGLAVSTWRLRVVIAVTAIWALIAVPEFVHARSVAGKSGNQDLRQLAQIIGAESHPGDGFLLMAEGNSVFRPRAALTAYPAEFEGLRDLAIDVPFLERNSFWDSVRMPTPDELATVDRVWVATRDSDLYSAELSAAGFAPGEAREITGMELVLWERQ